MVDDHECDAQTDSQVFVNGTRVPALDVDIHVRNEGDVAITRYATGETASPWNGVDYVEAFDTIDEDNQQTFDTLRIDVRDYASDTYETVFNGIVTGVGNGSESTERIWNWRAQGLGLLLNKIRVNKQWSGDDGVTPRMVIEFIRSELDDKVPLDVNSLSTLPEIDTDTDGEDVGQERMEELFGERNAEAMEAVGEEYNRVRTSKRFTENRHVLVDVVDWLSSKSDIYLWFEPTPEGVTLFSTKNPTGFTHDAHYLDGNLYVISNNALSELRPFNSLTARGQAKRSRKHVSEYEVDEPDIEYASATARHTQLYERAGETELVGRRSLHVDSQQKAIVENEARRELADQITETTGGDMETLLRSPIRPYDLVEARPTCEGSSATDVGSLTYEVSRVHYKIRSEDTLSSCLLNVGVAVDPQEDIEVTSKWVTSN